MQTMYKEWTSKPQNRRGRMVPLSALSVLEAGHDAGYMSVYMFSEEDAFKILQAGHSRDFDKFEVHSDTIYIDIDTGEADLKDCVSKLDKEGLGYYVYSSGSKGYHVTIPLDRTYSGSNIPYSQLEWVKSRGVKSDFSLYRAGSLISCPGRIHPKTGLKKKLIEKKEGKRATLTLIDPPAPKFDFDHESSTDSLKIGIAQLTSMVANPPDDGNRHLSLWKASKSLAEGGIPFDATLQFLQVVNDSWPSPKSANDVERAVRSAYDT
jgi:hypothetical protein